MRIVEGMPNYIRPKIPGSTVFFTVCLADRQSDLLVAQIDILREAVRVTRDRRPFAIDAWVVMPDHMHAVWTLPEGDTNYSDRWGAIKARFSKFVRMQAAQDTVGCKPTLPGAPKRSGAGGSEIADRMVGFQPTEVARLQARRSPSKVSKKEAGIWQRRFWDHHIRNAADYEAHVKYCLLNPVKHGLVERPEDWPFSSIHRDMRMGRWAA